MQQLLRRVRWGALVPVRWGWLRLCAAPSSYLLIVALLVTSAAKLGVLRELEGVGVWPLWWVAISAADAAFYLGLAALFALGERRFSWIMAVTIPLALLVAAVAVVNSAYLGIAGEQLSWQVMAVGLDRFGDVSGIVSEQAAELGWGSLVVAALVLFGIPGGALLLLRRRGRPLHPSSEAGARAHAAGLIAAVGLAVALLAPDPGAFALQRLSGNAVLRTYWGWLTDDRDARAAETWFQGYDPPGLVDEGGLAALRSGPRPSVVVIVLESVRRDATTLGGPGAPAKTPHLAALAARGLEVPGARAVVPHTTKSLFSMLCGRLPLMQLALIEAEGPLEIQCLPAALAAAGWRTGFFQSSLGVFEDRPRLARRLGFADFAAWEDIGGQLLGYLASDDESLAAPLAAWIDRDRERPFLAVLLTSATHHPYRLSSAAEAAGGPASSPRDRYHRLIEAQDRLIGQVNAILAERGLAERTILVAIGDHGEGFGEKGIRQHDNDFFEEGLRVPWAMAGPGVPRARVPGDASLVDLAPTLLELTGARVAPATEATTPARSLARGTSPGARLLVFSCWFDIRCRGFVGAGKKVVFIPELGRAFWFDLTADPREEDPHPLDDDMAGYLDRAHLIIDSHRTLEWPAGRAAMSDYPPWSCPAGQPCRHPKSPAGGLFGGD